MRRRSCEGRASPKPRRCWMPRRKCRNAEPKEQLPRRAVRPRFLAPDAASTWCWCSSRLRRASPSAFRWESCAARCEHCASSFSARSACIQTIPSLALLAFLIALLGTIGTVPALIALFLYALLPIVRNTHAGLEAIGAGMRQAALALGLGAARAAAAHRAAARACPPSSPASRPPR